MTLGQRIASYRTAARLSQGDLAEKLNVSRQSVSKWETDSSIPELDKLLQMSDLFGISLDTLVRGEKAAEESAPSPAPEISSEKAPIAEAPAAGSAFQAGLSTQSIVGFIFLALGLLSCILGLVLGGLLILLGIAMVIVGLVCLLQKKYAGLTIGWGAAVSLYFFLSRFTGAHPLGILRSLRYVHQLDFKISLIHYVALFYWALVIFVIVLTVRAIVKHKK